MHHEPPVAPKQLRIDEGIGCDAGNRFVRGQAKLEAETGNAVVVPVFSLGDVELCRKPDPDGNAQERRESSQALASGQDSSAEGFASISAIRASRT